jgi:hypothetical protein
MAGSYPRVVALNWAGGTEQEVSLNDQQFGVVGRVVIQVITSGGWNDAIRVYRRLQGADRATPAVTAPWVRSAYRNESGQADVNNTTDITAANIYSIWVDGTDVKLEQQGSGSTGTVTIVATAIGG